MVTAPEDPIEAIKRRNEERAQKLKEKIAAGEFFGFGEAIDEIAEEIPVQPVEQPIVQPAEQVIEPDSDFDLSSFPPPPDTGTIPVGEEESTASPIEIELTPPPDETAFVSEPAAESDTGLEIEVTPPTEEPFVAESLDLETEPAVVETPPPPPEEMIAETPPPADISGISFDGDEHEGFPVPEAWEGEETPAPAAEIELEPAIVEPTPEPVIEEPVPEPEPVVAEPTPEPESAAVEEPFEPAVTAEVEPERLVIKVDIEVQGNNVRVRRENIGMEGTIELFKKIIEKYEGIP